MTRRDLTQTIAAVIVLLLVATQCEADPGPWPKVDPGFNYYTR